VYDDNFQMKPNSLLTYLTRILYNRRSKFDPLWNNFIVAGVQDGKP
jgi:20S proteasome subunit beta 7